MLDYTKAAIKKTVDDFKRLDYIRNLATQILYVAYLTYAVLTPAGKLWADIPLLVLSVAYLVVFLVATTQNATQEKKKAKQVCTIVYTRCKQVIKLFTIVVMLYGIYAATTHVTAFSVILSALTIVGWILQVVFEVILKYFLSRAHFILEGMEADYETMLKPVKTVGNFFKKVAGKEVEPEKEKSKNRIWLDEKVAENKAAKLQEKLRKRQARADERATVYYDEDMPQFSQDENDELVPAPIVIEEKDILPAIQAEEKTDKTAKKRRWKKEKKGEDKQ